MPSAAVLALAVVLTGCADTGGLTLLTVDTDSYAVTPVGRTMAVVKVYDVRDVATMERTALNVSMGRIYLDPPVVNVIEAVVQSAADSLMAERSENEWPLLVMVGIQAFDITTPSTALYWDMTAEVELVLRIEDTEVTASAKSVNRTYAWPSQKRLQIVLDEALGELSANLVSALTDLIDR